MDTIARFKSRGKTAKRREGGDRGNRENAEITDVSCPSRTRVVSRLIRTEIVSSNNKKSIHIRVPVGSHARYRFELIRLIGGRARTHSPALPSSIIHTSPSVPDFSSRLNEPRVRTLNHGLSATKLSRGSRLQVTKAFSAREMNPFLLELHHHRAPFGNFSPLIPRTSLTFLFFLFPSNKHLSFKRFDG